MSLYVKHPVQLLDVCLREMQNVLASIRVKIAIFNQTLLRRDSVSVEKTSFNTLKIFRFCAGSLEHETMDMWQVIGNFCWFTIRPLRITLI